ncbi:MAG: PQQ-binding-like beta-propeller repeat protein [Myxococcales bacterium]|nr:PQQ-binding-like beta-propeller repeat protein [Myxococcales bacterium]
MKTASQSCGTPSRGATAATLAPASRVPFARIVATLAASLVSLGCGVFPPVEVHPDDRPPEAIQTTWRAVLNEPAVLAYRPKEYATPAYAHGGKLVMAGSERGTLVAANARDGRVAWRYQTGGKLRGRLTVSNDSVYFGATDGRLYRVETSSGSLAWDRPFDTRGAITAAPAVGGGRVFFRNNENRLYAVDAAKGTYLWDQGRGRREDLGITGEGSPTIAGEVVLAGFDDGSLSAMRVTDGASLWSVNIGGRETRFTDVDTTPVVIGDQVYAASFATGLYAVGLKHGGITWFHEGRGVQSPAADSRFLYVSTVDGELSALDPVKGAVAWTLELPWASLSAPVVAGDRIFVATGQGFVMADAATGRVLSRFSTDDGLVAPVASQAGQLHFVTNGGSLIGARLLH